MSISSLKISSKYLVIKLAPGLTSLLRFPVICMFKRKFLFLLDHHSGLSKQIRRLQMQPSLFFFIHKLLKIKNIQKKLLIIAVRLSSVFLL